MDRVFQIYQDLIEPLTKFYESKKPVDEAEYDILGTGTKQKLSELTEDKDKRAFKRKKQK